MLECTDATDWHNAPCFPCAVDSRISQQINAAQGAQYRAIFQPDDITLGKLAPMLGNKHAQADAREICPGFRAQDARFPAKVLTGHDPDVTPDQLGPGKRDVVIG